ncbi:hypothetical protein EKO27_g11822, partial [Xylaria grammica]
MTPHKTAAPSARPVPETWQMGTEAFERRMPHHDGIKALWETKWSFPCSKAVYPFHDGAYADFEPIFLGLIARGVDDGYSPAYTEAFFETAEALEKAGDEATAAGDQSAASSLYLRAACVLRIARFPKKVYLKAAGSWEVPIAEVQIPHVAAAATDRPVISAYVRVPPNQTASPAVLLFTGLDGYRPDNTG